MWAPGGLFFLCFLSRPHFRPQLFFFAPTILIRLVPSLARSVPKLLKVPSLARAVPKPLKGPSLARSVPKPLN